VKLGRFDVIVSAFFKENRSAHAITLYATEDSLMLPKAVKVAGHTSLISKQDFDEYIFDRIIKGIPTKGDGEEARMKLGLFFITKFIKSN
jgi:hypothetical protein